MHVAYALICSAMLYGIFFLVGRAAVGVFCKQLDTKEARAISSVVGLAVLTLVSTYLVLLGVPLREASEAVTLSIIVLSISTVLSLNIPIWERNTILSCVKNNAPFFMTVFLIFLPFALGGYEFAILRGNGTDSFNYVTMADALSHYSLDWILKQPKEVLASYSPNLPLAQYLLQSRWSTSALLAFISDTFGISPIEFEFAFTLALMITLYDALVATLLAISSLSRLTIWFSAIFVSGFWGQFILDLRAFSQMGGMPLMVVLIGWSLSPMTSSSKLFRYGGFLTAVLVAALCFQYPEIVIPFLPGVGLLFLLRLWMGYRKKNNFERYQDIKDILAFLLSIFLLVTSIFNFLIRFAYTQTHFAIGKSPGWEWAYFTWMIKNPISGIWGLSVKPDLGVPFNNVYFDFALLVALGLTFVFVARSISILSSRQLLRENQTEVFLIFIIATGIFGISFLLKRGNIFAAGKVLSYFSILTPIWMGLSLYRENYGSFNLRFHKILSRALVGVVFGWCVLNFIFAGSRILHATNGSELSSFYIAQHGEHRRVDAGAVAKIPYSGCPIDSSVAVFETTDWEREFLTHLLEGRGFSVTTPGNYPTRDSSVTPYALQTHMGCVLTQRRYFDSNETNLNDLNSNGFLFGRSGSSYVALLRLSGGYGVERNPLTGARFVWFGLQQDIMLTLGARASAYSVVVRLCPAVAREETDPIVVFLAIDGKKVSSRKIETCSNWNILMAGNALKALRSLRFTMKDLNPNIRLKGSDPRDLRLRMEVESVRMIEAH